MGRNQTWQKQENGTMLLVSDGVVADVFEPLTQERLVETLNGTDISAMILVDIITAFPQIVPHNVSDVDTITSYRTTRLLSLNTDNETERINKTLKQLIHLGFAHEVRIRVLEGKATTAGDRTAADNITTDFITFVTKFRTIRQEGEDYKIANGL